MQQVTVYKYSTLPARYAKLKREERHRLRAAWENYTGKSKPTLHRIISLESARLMDGALTPIYQEFFMGFFNINLREIWEDEGYNCDELPNLKMIPQ